MFITGTTYDPTKDYNMMLDKTLLDCFEEVPIRHEAFADILKEYEPAPSSTKQCKRRNRRGKQATSGASSSTQSRPPASEERF